MTNKLFTILFILISKIALAQNVGIGTTTPASSAALEIAATNKGILIPRVFLSASTDATTIPNPATYLMVYNTNTVVAAGLTGDGLYVNIGTAAAPNWQRVGTGPTGATGPQGPAGRIGTSGTSQQVFVGGIVGSIAGNVAQNVYVFAGPTGTVTTTATQKILLWGVLPIGLAPATPIQTASIGAGYQPQAGGVIKNMVGGLYSTVEVGTERHGYAIAGSVTPGAGTWKIGAVVSNTGAYNITNNDYVNLICLVVEQ